MNQGPVHVSVFGKTVKGPLYDCGIVFQQPAIDLDLTAIGNRVDAGAAAPHLWADDAWADGADLLRRLPPIDQHQHLLPWLTVALVAQTLQGGDCRHRYRRGFLER